MDLVTALAMALTTASAAPPAWAIRRYYAYHAHKGEAVGLTSTDVLGQLLGEGMAFATLGAWHLRAFFADGWRVPDEVTGPPVVAVHGYTQNATNMWGIRRALEARGRSTRAVSMGWPGRTIESYAPRLVRVLEEAADRHPDGFDVVAHSMGGVILRVALRDNPALAARLRRVVTLGAPHGGTASARGLFGAPELHGLRRRSPLIADLPHFAELAPRAQVVTVAGGLDVIVYPRHTSHVVGSRAVDLPVGHAALLVDRRAIAVVVEAICQPDQIRCQLDG